MLEAGLTQGAGLRALRSQAAPRLVAVASHDDRPSEWPLLCSLCATWSDLGYSVVVLDATLAESASGPGLQQLLDDPASQPADVCPDHANWPIVPAALGLKQLCLGTQDVRSGRACLLRLGQLFHSHEIILVLASAQQLSAYLPDSGIEPLLAVSSKAMSLLSAYQSLKQLLLVGRLEPTIVSVMNEFDQINPASSSSMCKSLQDCAQTFLSHPIAPLPVYVPPPDSPPLDDMRRLALRLMESALSLRNSAVVSNPPRIRRNPALARSH